jgi:hypothetical protein
MPALLEKPAVEASKASCANEIRVRTTVLKASELDVVDQPQTPLSRKKSFKVTRNIWAAHPTKWRRTVEIVPSSAVSSPNSMQQDLG